MKATIYCKNTGFQMSVLHICMYKSIFNPVYEVNIKYMHKLKVNFFFFFCFIYFLSSINVIRLEISVLRSKCFYEIKVKYNTSCTCIKYS